MPQFNANHIFSVNARRLLSASCFLLSISSAEHSRLERLSDMHVCFKPRFEQTTFGVEEQSFLEMTGMAEDIAGANRS